MFENTAKYRKGSHGDGAFSMADVMKSEAVQNIAATSALKSTINGVRSGICMAYVLEWIRNKTLDAERIQHAPNRMDNFRSLRVAVDVMIYQEKLEQVFDECGADLKVFLERAEVRAPQPIEVPYGPLPFNDCALLVGFTLTTHTPYFMSYEWGDAAHAIALYRTMNKYTIFDPNCGELSCQNASIEIMWADYEKDLKALRPGKGLPHTFNLASVGVVPVRPRWNQGVV